MPPVSSHHRLKNEVCYTFIPLVSSHDGLKNEICYTLIKFVSLCTSPDCKIGATWTQYFG